MATQQISILSRLSPDTSGDVFWQPWSVLATTGAIDCDVLVFQDSGNKDGAAGFFTVPQDYVGAPVLVIVWAANDGTTNSVVWDWSMTPRSGTEDMDAAAAHTVDSVTDAKTATAFQRQEARMTSMSAADFAAGDNVFGELFRDGANASDTVAASVAVFDVLFEYSDT